MSSQSSQVLAFQALPSRQIRASATTLFHVAEMELGDATLWEKVADLNGLIDPWIDAEVTLKIPNIAGTTSG